MGIVHAFSETYTEVLKRSCIFCYGPQPYSQKIVRVFFEKKCEILPLKIKCQLSSTHITRNLWRVRALAQHCGIHKHLNKKDESFEQAARS
jgi:hypothetical protein